MILNLTLARIKQVRDIVSRRQAEEFDRHLQVEEVKLRHLVGAVHAAAGNEQAGEAADAVRLRGERSSESRAKQVGKLVEGEKAPDWLPSAGPFEQAVAGSVR